MVFDPRNPLLPSGQLDGRALRDIAEQAAQQQNQYVAGEYFQSGQGTVFLSPGSSPTPADTPPVVTVPPSPPGKPPPVVVYPPGGPPVTILNANVQIVRVTVTTLSTLRTTTTTTLQDSTLATGAPGSSTLTAGAPGGTSSLQGLLALPGATAGAAPVDLSTLSAATGSADPILVSAAELANVPGASVGQAPAGGASVSSGGGASVGSAAASSGGASVSSTPASSITSAPAGSSITSIPARSTVTSVVVPQATLGQARIYYPCLVQTWDGEWHDNEPAWFLPANGMPPLAQRYETLQVFTHTDGLAVYSCEEDAPAYDSTTTTYTGPTTVNFNGSTIINYRGPTQIRYGGSTYYRGPVTYLGPITYVFPPSYPNGIRGGPNDVNFFRSNLAQRWYTADTGRTPSPIETHDFAETQWFLPFVTPAGGVPSAIAVYVTVPIGNSSCRLGLYSRRGRGGGGIADNRPDRLLFDSGVLDTSVPGLCQAALNRAAGPGQIVSTFAFQPGELYYLSFVTAQDRQATIRAMQAGDLCPLAGMHSDFTQPSFAGAYRRPWPVDTDFELINTTGFLETAYPLEEVRATVPIPLIGVNFGDQRPTPTEVTVRRRPAAAARAARHGCRPCLHVALLQRGPRPACLCQCPGTAHWQCGSLRVFLVQGVFAFGGTGR